MILKVLDKSDIIERTDKIDDFFGLVHVPSDYVGQNADEVKRLVYREIDLLDVLKNTTRLDVV